MPEYTAGHLAYVDTLFSGLVPCKVVSVGEKEITVKLTATRKAYKRGEVINFPRHDVIPREHIYRRNWQFYIRGGYTWKTGSIAS